MALSAEQAFKKSQEKQAEIKENSLKAFREKCVNAVTEMVSQGGTMVEVDLDSDDFRVMTEITDEMRELDYKFCLVEERDSETKEIGDRYLRISVAHIK